MRKSLLGLMLGIVFFTFTTDSRAVCSTTNPIVAGTTNPIVAGTTNPIVCRTTNSIVACVGLQTNLHQELYLARDTLIL